MGIKCPRCGKEIGIDVAYCPSCGIRINSKGNAADNTMKLNSKNNSYQKSEETKNKSLKGFDSVAIVCGIVGLVLSFVVVGSLVSVVGLVFSVICLACGGNKVKIVIGLITSILGIIIAVMVFTYLITQPNDDSTNNILEEKDTVTDENITNNELVTEYEIKSAYADPDSYIDKEISVTIQVLAEPEYGTDEVTYIQGCRSIEDDLYVDFTLVKYEKKDFTCNVGDYVQINGKVYGYIEPEEGKDNGALGIIADSVDIIQREDDPKVQEGNKLEIERTEIYNGNGVSIVLSEIEESNSVTTMSFELSSESEKDYSISVHSFSINGLMAGGNSVGSDVDLPSGKKAKFSVEVKNQWMDENRIEKIAQIDFLFWAYYDGIKEWDSGIVEIKTNLYNENLMYSVVGEEVYSNENVTIWYEGNNGDEYSFIIRNNNSYNSNYTLENCSVNNWSYEVTRYTYDLYNEPIHANSYAVFVLPVDASFMEEYGISKIENIEFNVLLGQEATEKIKIIN